MRAPPFRITVRTLLLLVAITAIAFGAIILQRRSDEYGRRATLYARIEQMALESLAFSRRMARLDARLRGDDLRGDSRRTEEIALKTNYAEYVGALRRKYENAARRPWLAIPPDPPPPGPEERARYWLSRGEYGRALRVYEETISSYPHLPCATVAYNDRAWIWATCPDSQYRDGPRAVESATVACVRTGCMKVPFLSTLAAAYAECGEFALAVRWQNDALGRVPPESPEWRELDQRLQRFLQRRPYRDVRADRN